MKTILLTLTLLFLSRPAAAQESYLQPISGDTLDFGTCNHGDTIEGVFAFTIKGTEKLMIRQVHPGCQCTVPMYPKDSMQPGTTDSIVLALHTRNLHAGPIEKYAIVINTGPERIFYLKGEILEHSTASPRKRVVRGRTNVDLKK